VACDASLRRVSSRDPRARKTRKSLLLRFRRSAFEIVRMTWLAECRNGNCASATPLSIRGTVYLANVLRLGRVQTRLSRARARGRLFMTVFFHLLSHPRRKERGKGTKRRRSRHYRSTSSSRRDLCRASATRAYRLPSFLPSFRAAVIR